MSEKFSSSSEIECPRCKKRFDAYENFQEIWDESFSELHKGKDFFCPDCSKSFLVKIETVTHFVSSLFEGESA